MASPSGRAVIAVATSIPPRLVRWDPDYSGEDDYQKLCIRSWIDSGFRIVSVNDREEIPVLAARHPDVDFVATDRNGSAWSGRRTPYIADLLLALMSAPEPVLGIINADLVFEASPAWAERLPSLVSEAMVVGHRCNANSLLRGAVLMPFQDGLDYFFFDRALAREALEHAMPFAMGLPWWDFWLPCVAALNNRNILVVDRPSVVHLVHKQGFRLAALWEFAQIFTNFVIGRCDSASYPLPERLAKIVTVCRTIAELPRDSVTNREGYIRNVSRLVNLLVSQILTNVVRLDSKEMQAADARSTDGDVSFESPSRGGVRTPDNVFRHFEQRRAAGKALAHAIRLMDENRMAEAEPKLLAAFEQAPNDFNVLLTVGKFEFRRGRFHDAHLMLSKAAEQKPNSTRLLQLIGATLHEMGKSEEAIECFEKILVINPKFQTAYTDIAIVLWKANRRREALAYLERAIRQWQHFATATELYDRFSMDLGGFQAIPARIRQAKKLARYLRYRLSAVVTRVVNRPARNA